MENIDFRVIKEAYDWELSIDGELFGLTSADKGFEPTGIKLTGELLEIWELGYAEFLAKRELKTKELGPRDLKCSCRTCLREYDKRIGETIIPTELTMFVVCSICGNKRCPHAENHDFSCTNSNEVNQEMK